MAYTTEEITAELKRRGISHTSYTTDEAKAELMRRGIQPPESKISQPRSDNVGPAAMYQGMGKQLISALGGAGKGILDVGANIGNLEAQGIDKLFGSSFAKDTPYVQMPKSVQQRMKQYPKTSLVGEFAGSMAAIPGLSEVGAMTKIGSEAKKAASLLGARKGLANLIGSVAESGTTGAIAAPIFNPQAPLSKSVPEGALAGSSLHLAGHSIGEGVKFLANAPRNIKSFLAKHVGGTATPEEMEYNLNAAKKIGVDDLIPLGEIANSPHLKTLSGVLSKIPGTQRAQDNMAIGSKIKDSVENYIKKTKIPEEDSISDASNRFIKDITNGRAKEKKSVGKMYEDAEKIANKNNIKVIKNSLYDAAETIKKDIKHTDLENDNSIKNILSNIEQKETSVIYGSRPKKEITFNDANALRKEINKGFRNTNYDEKEKTRILSIAKNALDHDIKSSSKESEELFSKVESANKYYRNNILPLDSKDIMDYIVGGKDPDTFVNTFLKMGNRDNLLNKVSDHLKGENKYQFANIFLTKESRTIGGEEKHNADKILSMFAKLPDNAKNKLFSPYRREKLESAYHVKNMMGGDLKQMLNPKTGEMTAKTLSLIASGAIPATQLYQGGLSEENMEIALAEFAAIKGTKKGLSKFMKSPFIKKATIKSQKALKSRPKKIKTQPKLGLFGLPAMGQGGSDNER